MSDFPETDWRVLRSLHDPALERYCTRVLDDVAVIARGSGTAHERYLRLFRAVRDHDDHIAQAFNDSRRSRAMLQLVALTRLGLVTDEEFSRFSEPTRETVRGLLDWTSK
jgi:hypothetical protein